MWEDDKGERNLGSISLEVAPNTPEVTGPGNAAWMNQQASRDMKIDRERDGDEYKKTPACRITREDRAGCD